MSTFSAGRARFPGSSTSTQLSALESAGLHARWAWRGLCDANRWLRVLSAIFGCARAFDRTRRAGLTRTRAGTRSCARACCRPRS
jgi:hypothetical protein